MNNLTVIIPAYNSEEYILEAINSAKRCLCRLNPQIIVVDDGSRDNTSEVAQEAGVLCVRHPSNRGIASGLNTAIATATTEYVAWLSSDDLYAEDAGFHLEAAINKFPQADFFFGRYDEFSKNRTLSGASRPVGFEKLGHGAITVDWFVDLLVGCFVNGATTVIRRSRLIELGLFDTGYRYSQDYAMWLLMSYHNVKTVFLDQTIVLRRLHDGQLSANSQVKRTIRLENRQLLTRYLSIPAVWDRVQERITRLTGSSDRYRIELLKRLFHLGLYRKAGRLLGTCDSAAQTAWTISTHGVGHLGRRWFLR